MNNKAPQQFCQSCMMPIDAIETRGTEADGTASDDYCCYCYQNGAFTSDTTMQQMIEFCIPPMVELGHDEKEARTMMEQAFPTLKRWAAQ